MESEITWSDEKMLYLYNCLLVIYLKYRIIFIIKCPKICS